MKTVTELTESPFLVRVTARADRVGDAAAFPLSLPFVRDLHLDLAHHVTFFVGENGSGKSTLLEALADACGYPVAGGGKNDAELAAREHSALTPSLRVGFRRRPRDGYFFRAENLASFADLLDRRKDDPEFEADPYARYGGRSLHARSHGEAFLDVLRNRIGGGLFLLDEPEAALSPQRQLALLVLMDRLVAEGETQFIAATHSPILLTFPGATIVSFDEPSLPSIRLEETSHYQITKSILADPERYWGQLRRDDPDAEDSEPE
jgi:predicted ATPase